MSSAALITPPQPTTPLPAQGAKGEMRLTPGGVMAFDGRSWLPADLWAAIVDDPANFEHVNVSTSLETPVLQVTSQDAAEVIPASISGFVAGSGSTRSPILNVQPPVLYEGDISSLAAVLQLWGTSPDGTGKPAAFLWTKQAGTVYISAVTDIGTQMNSYISVADAHLNLYANGKGSPSPGIELDGATGLKFVGAENHSGGQENHSGIEIHSGPAHFNSTLSRGGGAIAGTDYVKAYLAAAFNHATSGSWLPLPLDTTYAAVEDDGLMFFPPSSFFTAPVNGFYTGVCHMTAATINATGRRGIRWMNGTQCVGVNLIATNASASVQLQCHFSEYLFSGQSVQLQAFQDSGTTIAFGPQSAGTPCYASMQLVG